MKTYDDLLAAGLTPRRVEWWTQKGWIRPDVTHPGNGRARRWPADEVRIGALMVRMVDAGISPEAAHRVARAGGALELAPGVRVEAVPA